MRPGARVVAATLLALSVIAGACTVSTNEEPVEVSSELFDPLLTTTSSTTTTLPGNATKEVTEYFIRTTDNVTELIEVRRELDVDAGVQAILADLFSRRPDRDGDERAQEAGLSSAIPESAELVDATIQPGSATLVIDARGLFGPDGIQGSSLANALAQIVWTAIAGSDDVREVTFQNDGQKVPALTGSGENTEEPVDRGDYPRNFS